MKQIIFLFCILLNISCSSKINYITDYQAKNSNGLVNVVIEIPSGTSEKWEVDKPDGKLALEYIGAEPRIIKYIPYPFNYGMIPNTLLTKAQGGDGDPLDAIVIGDSIERGKVISGKVIGVLRMLDDGEQDDKIIILSKNTPLYFVNNVEQLKQEFPGILQIISIWFKNYKGTGEIKIQGFANHQTAKKIIDDATNNF